MTTQLAPAKLVNELERASVPYELLTHPHTTSAVAEARTLGLDPSAVAKTVVLVVPEGFARAVLPASERVDLAKIRVVLDSKQVRLASEKALAGAYPGFELGAVPPLTLGERDPVLVDRRLLEHEWVVLEAGTHDRSIRMRTVDLVGLSGARVVDLAQD
jgi:Ala-tRNA(Pro) deacylase